MGWWWKDGWVGSPPYFIYTHHVFTPISRHQSFPFVVTFLCSSPHWVRVRQDIAMLSALTACGEGCSWVEVCSVWWEESSADDLGFSCCECGVRKACELATEMRRLVARVLSKRNSVELYYWSHSKLVYSRQHGLDVPSPPLPLIRDRQLLAQLRTMCFVHQRLVSCVRRRGDTTSPANKFRESMSKYGVHGGDSVSGEKWRACVKVDTGRRGIIQKTGF